MRNNINYSKVCSCCGGGISPQQLSFLKENGEYDSEGNYCVSCYNEVAMNNQLELMGTIDEVYNKLNPLNRFKFKMKTFEEKTDIIFRLMNKGIITFKIG